MISLLISGGTLTDRQTEVTKKLSSNIYNLQIGDGAQAVSIEQIRDLQKSLSLAISDGNTRTCIIWEVQNLSLPAQQALLKLIEEPPAHTQIILTVDNANLLPATILSRCILTNLKTPEYKLTSDEQKEIKEILQIVSTQSYAAVLKLAEKIAKNSDPQKPLLNTLIFIRNGMLSQPSIKRAEVIRLLQETIGDLQTNMNPQLAIEHCLLTIRKLNN